MLKKTKRKLQKKTVQKTEITSAKTLGTSNRKTLAVLLEESKTFSVAKRSDSPSHYKPVPLGVLLNCCWAGWSELVDDGAITSQTLCMRGSHCCFDWIFLKKTLIFGEKRQKRTRMDNLRTGRHKLVVLVVSKRKRRGFQG